MRFRQRQPLDPPPSGPAQRIPAHCDTIFDWRYGLEHEKLVALYDKAQASQWRAEDLDWSIPVDLHAIMEERMGAATPEFIDAAFNPPRRLTPREWAEFEVNVQIWMLSQFLHGEQGALVATAKIVQSAPLTEAKWYAASQVADEARHVEVYHRYLTEKAGCSFAVNREFQTLLEQIIRDRRWDMTYLGMQIMVEGLALAAFGLIRIMMPNEPLIQDITNRIMGDEARHVAFGVLSLADFYRDLSAAEMREREDFVIEATNLMRDRLLAEQVYERMGWDVAEWLRWSQDTPFMRAFRQMLFSKIVPNLKRLGLLTPRVRAEYARLGLLEYENGKDSSEDPEVTPPAEFVRLLFELSAGAAYNGAA